MRNLSNRTVESYWWHINDYGNFIGRDPELTGTDDLRKYFLHMLSGGRTCPGSVKMGYYALKFLFTQVYHKEWASQYLPTPKVAKTLPVVLAREEVADVFDAIHNLKHRIIIMFIYSTGARVSECINVKVTDIDSKRMQVNIQQGKGQKQRYVPLSPFLLDALRIYYKHADISNTLKYLHVQQFTIDKVINPLDMISKTGGDLWIKK